MTCLISAEGFSILSMGFLALSGVTLYVGWLSERCHIHAQLHLSYIGRVGWGAGSQGKGSGLVSNQQPWSLSTSKLNNNSVHSFRNDMVIYGYHSSTI